MPWLVPSPKRFQGSLVLTPGGHKNKWGPTGTSDLVTCSLKCLLVLKPAGRKNK